ncbi:glutamate--cysteine ligase [Afifella sp. H1R]|uniref:glutamate--cysteine ligase n=1 Tax=Afifella sp. H1R TaxID=2908841 RepID=UPI001F37BD2D|nr:glutamate--cysteine ligase [Afifella sp. H1R]MCF1504575.1 glutamate--cysteine ligase [Afifella sp. H1R]
MARDTANDNPIENRDQLVSSIEKGVKPRQQWKIGTEHEKVPFYRDGNRPVPYHGEKGIEAVLKGMETLLGWEPIYDGENIIGLGDPTGGGAISLEPGGQFELSGAPLPNIHRTCRETHAHLAQVREVAEPLGIGFLGIGMSPKWSRAATPIMPKQRYRIMADYMPKVGGKGLDMMLRTTTIQVNLDFSSEADMVRKMRVGLALQPIATALFANSPFTEGRPNGFLSYRAEIWRDTDRNRTGLLPFAFEKGFGFERYVDWALDVPMYFIIRGGRYVDMTHTTFRQFLKEPKIDDIGEVTPSMGDWFNHLSTLFPDVRLKTFLEMRGADGGPTRRICALPAFWTGILYDDDALAAAESLTYDWSEAEREALRNHVPKTGLATPFRRETVLDIAKRAVAISRTGLKHRNQISAGGFNEAEYLAPLEETLALKRTPAEELLAQYRTRWGNSVEPLFSEYAY